MDDNVILLPHHSDFFHPDLTGAADAVIGKTGYSTIAEVYHAGVPFGYIACPHNPESALLTEFIENRMAGSEISETEFHEGSWLSQLQRLLDLPHIKRNEPNGADQIAQFMLGLLS
jgi:UDP-N-acetylglucosamine:LPS N-acetylglucosamine transferase